MRLREVIRAVDGFQYEVVEHTLLPSGLVARDKLTIASHSTKIRCLQHNMWHEKLVAGKWFILTPEQFNDELRAAKNRTVIRRSGGTEKKLEKKELTLVDRLILTDHAKERMVNRFGVNPNNFKGFLTEKLAGHFVVQNFEFYNKRYKSHNPEDLIVCSRDFKAVFAVVVKKNRFVVVTVYDPLTSEFSSFSNWFQDHMDVVHKLPTLEQYFTK